MQSKEAQLVITPFRRDDVLITHHIENLIFGDTKQTTELLFSAYDELAKNNSNLGKMFFSVIKEGLNTGNLQIVASSAERTIDGQHAYMGVHPQKDTALIIVALGGKDFEKARSLLAHELSHYFIKSIIGSCDPSRAGIGSQLRWRLQSALLWNAFTSDHNYFGKMLPLLSDLQKSIGQRLFVDVIDKYYNQPLQQLLQHPKVQCTTAQEFFEKFFPKERPASFGGRLWARKEYLKIYENARAEVGARILDTELLHPGNVGVLSPRCTEIINGFIATQPKIDVTQYVLPRPVRVDTERYNVSNKRFFYRDGNTPPSLSYFSNRRVLPPSKTAKLLTHQNINNNIKPAHFNRKFSLEGVFRTVDVKRYGWELPPKLARKEYIKVKLTGVGEYIKHADGTETCISKSWWKEFKKLSLKDYFKILDYRAKFGTMGEKMLGTSITAGLEGWNIYSNFKFSQAECPHLNFMGHLHNALKITIFNALLMQYPTLAVGTGWIVAPITILSILGSLPDYQEVFNNAWSKIKACDIDKRELTDREIALNIIYYGNPWGPRKGLATTALKKLTPSEFMALDPEHYMEGWAAQKVGQLINIIFYFIARGLIDKGAWRRELEQDNIEYLQSLENNKTLPEKNSNGSFHTSHQGSKHQQDDHPCLSMMDEIHRASPMPQTRYSLASDNMTPSDFVSPFSQYNANENTFCGLSLDRPTKLNKFITQLFIDKVLEKPKKDRQPVPKALKNPFIDTRFLDLKFKPQKLFIAQQVDKIDLETSNGFGAEVVITTPTDKVDPDWKGKILVPQESGQGNPYTNNPERAHQNQMEEAQYLQGKFIKLTLPRLHHEIQNIFGKYSICLEKLNNLSSLAIEYDSIQIKKLIIDFSILIRELESLSREASFFVSDLSEEKIKAYCHKYKLTDEQVKYLNALKKDPEDLFSHIGHNLKAIPRIIDELKEMLPLATGMESINVNQEKFAINENEFLKNMQNLLSHKEIDKNELMQILSNINANKELIISEIDALLNLTKDESFKENLRLQRERTLKRCDKFEFLAKMSNSANFYKEIDTYFAQYFKDFMQKTEFHPDDYADAYENTFLYIASASNPEELFQRIECIEGILAKSLPQSIADNFNDLLANCHFIMFMMDPDGLFNRIEAKEVFEQNYLRSKRQREEILTAKENAEKNSVPANNMNNAPRKGGSPATHRDFPGKTILEVFQLQKQALQQEIESKISTQKDYGKKIYAGLKAGYHIYDETARMWLKGTEEEKRIAIVVALSNGHVIQFYKYRDINKPKNERGDPIEVQGAKGLNYALDMAEREESERLAQKIVQQSSSDIADDNRQDRIDDRHLSNIAGQVAANISLLEISEGLRYLAEAEAINPEQKDIVAVSHRMTEVMLTIVNLPFQLIHRTTEALLPPERTRTYYALKLVRQLLNINYNHATLQEHLLSQSVIKLVFHYYGVTFRDSIAFRNQAIIEQMTKMGWITYQRYYDHLNLINTSSQFIVSAIEQFYPLNHRLPNFRPVMELMQTMQSTVMYGLQFATSSLYQNSKELFNWSNISALTPQFFTTALTAGLTNEKMILTDKLIPFVSFVLQSFKKLQRSWQGEHLSGRLDYINDALTSNKVALASSWGATLYSYAFIAESIYLRATANRQTKAHAFIKNMISIATLAGVSASFLWSYFFESKDKHVLQDAQIHLKAKQLDKIMESKNAVKQFLNRASKNESELVFAMAHEIYAHLCAAIEIPNWKEACEHFDKAREKYAQYLDKYTGLTESENEEIKRRIVLLALHYANALIKMKKLQKAKICLETVLQELPEQGNEEVHVDVHINLAFIAQLFVQKFQKTSKPNWLSIASYLSHAIEEYQLILDRYLPQIQEQASEINDKKLYLIIAYVNALIKSDRPKEAISYLVNIPVTGNKEFHQSVHTTLVLALSKVENEEAKEIEEIYEQFKRAVAVCNKALSKTTQLSSEQIEDLQEQRMQLKANMVQCAFVYSHAENKNKQKAIYFLKETLAELKEPGFELLCHKLYLCLVPMITEESDDIEKYKLIADALRICHIIINDNNNSNHEVEFLLKYYEMLLEIINEKIYYKIKTKFERLFNIISQGNNKNNYGFFNENKDINTIINDKYKKLESFLQLAFKTLTENQQKECEELLLAAKFSIQSRQKTRDTTNRVKIRMHRDKANSSNPNRFMTDRNSNVEEHIEGLPRPVIVCSGTI